MLIEGQTITAVVTAIKFNAAELKEGPHNLLLLGPDASPEGNKAVETLFQVGDMVRVKILKYNQTDGIYRVTRKILRNSLTDQK